MNTPPCPECQKPMRIERIKAQRVFKCPSFGCFGYLNIDDDERLSIEVMAHDMVQGLFTNSDQLKKNQAQYRKLAGGLKNCEGRHYLSQSEDEHLNEAIRILERLATAAEKSKTVKKRLEAEREELRKKRTRQIYSLVETQLPDPQEQLVQYMTVALALNALAQVGSVKSFEYNVLHERIVEQRSVPEVTSACVQLARQSTAELADRYYDRVADDMDQRLLQLIKDEIDRVAHKHQGILEQLERVLAIEQDDKVIRIHPGSKP